MMTSVVRIVHFQHLPFYVKWQKLYMYEIETIFNKLPQLKYCIYKQKKLSLNYLQVVSCSI